MSVFENECGLTAMQMTKRQHRNDFTSLVSAVAASLGRAFLFDGEPIEPASTTPVRG